MPAIWNGTLSTVRCDVDGLDWPVALTVHPRARRLKLRLDPERRELRLTVPPRASRRAALRWVQGQREWVASQLANLPRDEPFAPGESFPFEGRPVRIDWQRQLPRSPRLAEGILHCGGPLDGLARRVERFLRAEALAILSHETAAAAGRAGVAVRSVAIGDAAAARSVLRRIGPRLKRIGRLG